MSLLSVNLRERRRLFLKDTALRREPIPAPEAPAIFTPIPEKPYTEAERNWSKLLSAYPILRELEEALGLSNPETGETYRRVISEEEPITAPAIAEPETAYTLSEITTRIGKRYRLSKAEALRELERMTEAGEIQQTINPTLYHLGSSTPF